MAEEDEGWGGTADEAWGSAAAPTPPAPPVFPPGQTQGPTPGLTSPAPPEGPQPGKRGWLYGGIGAVVVVVAVVLAVVLSGGGSKKKAEPTPGPSASTVPSSSPPTISTSPTASASGTLLSKAAVSGCTNAPKVSFNTSKVLEQIVCVGPAVQTKTSAQGMSYAQFGSTADLNAWYNDTILKANGITPNEGNCVTGVTVATNGGAQYCEGPFTDDTGTTARQLVVLAPATINLTNGPNATKDNCPGSSYTLLVFTSPSDNVGVVALTCGATPANARALETHLNAGDFDLND